MKIEHIRNACMIIHYRDQAIIVDPCLNKKGSLPPYTLFRKMPQLNPIVDLPPTAELALSQITCGLITPFPTKHGQGIIGKFMGQGPGYFIELPGDKTVYISGDTLMNQTVRNVLNDLRPDISILNAGTATLDFGRPILMPLNEILDFIKAAPSKVVAVHLDAFNHCLTTRSMLRAVVSKEGLSDKVMIPADGELMEF